MEESSSHGGMVECVELNGSSWPEEWIEAMQVEMQLPVITDRTDQLQGERRRKS